MMALEVIRLSKEEKVCISSLEVADVFGKEHKHVMRDIRELGCSEEFNATNFGLIKYKDTRNRTQEAYVMTRDGFTLLVMGYTGEKAMKFKEDYIKQFNNMEKLLTEKLIEREKGVVVRLALTKALQNSIENERMHGHAYPTYTNMIYKILFGMNAKELREYFNLDKKANIRDCFTKEQLEQVQASEQLVSGLIALGWKYDQIKEFIEQNNTRKLMLAN